MHRLVFLLATVCYSANAAEIYKWTDENGKTHFGDRLSAPSRSEKFDIKIQPQNQVPAEQKNREKFPEQKAKPRIPPAPSLGSPKQSVPVDPSLVGPRCKALIDEVAKVKRGKIWTSLYNEFNRLCPGITYECNYYRARPEDNGCTWVERTGKSILQKNIYQ